MLVDSCYQVCDALHFSYPFELHYSNYISTSQLRLFCDGGLVIEIKSSSEKVAARTMTGKLEGLIAVAGAPGAFSTRFALSYARVPTSFAFPADFAAFFGISHQTIS